MTRLTKADREELAAIEMWREWGDQFDWALYGCNGPFSASFLRGKERALIEVTDGMRADIDRAIARAIQAARLKEGSSDG